MFHSKILCLSQPAHIFPPDSITRRARAFKPIKVFQIQFQDSGTVLWPAARQEGPKIIRVPFSFSNLAVPPGAAGTDA